MRVFASVRSLPAAGVGLTSIRNLCCCRDLNPRRLIPPLRSRPCPVRRRRSSPSPECWAAEGSRGRPAPVPAARAGHGSLEPPGGVRVPVIRHASVLASRRGADVRHPDGKSDRLPRQEDAGSRARLRDREVASSDRGINFDRTCTGAVTGICISSACHQRTVHDRARGVRCNNCCHRDLRVDLPWASASSRRARAREDDAGPPLTRQPGHGQVWRRRLGYRDAAARRRVADVHHPEGERDCPPRARRSPRSASSEA